eukprot:m.144430 g.144430  ORF g.144430 m.144430 type:complete len:67 (-) comp16768_c2_seq5:398-598(-)
MDSSQASTGLLASVSVTNSAAMAFVAVVVALHVALFGYWMYKFVSDDYTPRMEFQRPEHKKQGKHL